MPNKKIVVVNDQKLSLKEETRVVFEQYVTDCIRNAEGPAKQVTDSFVDHLINYLIICVRRKFAA